MVCDWLLSFNVFSRFIHVATCISISFTFFAERYSFHHKVIPHFVYSVTSWRTFGFFRLLAILDNAGVNICVLVFEWTYGLGGRLGF